MIEMYRKAERSHRLGWVQTLLCFIGCAPIAVVVRCGVAVV